MKRSLKIPLSGIKLRIIFYAYHLCIQHIVKHKRYLFITPKQELIGAIVKYSIGHYVTVQDLDVKLLSMAMLIKSTTATVNTSNQ